VEVAQLLVALELQRRQALRVVPAVADVDALDSYGIVTAEPVLSTTIVLGLAAATASIRLSSVLPSGDSQGSFPPVDLR